MVAAVASLIMLILADRNFAGGFSIGCATMIVNLYFLFLLIQKIFNSDTAQAGGYSILLVVKFAVLAVFIYALYRYLHINLLAFCLGFFLIAISATCVTGSMQKQSIK